MTANRNSVIILLSFPLLAGLILTSLVGLTQPGFYFRETANWQAQSVGQDTMDLFLIAPVLLTSTILAFRGSTIGLWIWGGVNLYLLYTFCLYSFDIHFNQLFIVYCFNLGMSFYSFLYFIYRQLKIPLDELLPASTIHKITGLYFLINSFVFYALWLSEVIPAILEDKIPPSLEAVGLPTNGVHVIDLSVFLPGLFITGILLLKRKRIGYILAQVCLVFMVLMALTIAGLNLIMKQRGLEAETAVVGMMAILALMSILLFVWQSKAMPHTLQTKNV